MAFSERQRILITVLTYPHPSQKYQETVCTAGITESGLWVRLYPLPLRSLPKEQQLRKWHWVEIDTLRPTNDTRPESRRPVIDGMVVGAKLDPTRDREERRRLIDQLPHRSLSEWEEAYSVDKTSLGVLIPKRVMAVEHDHEDEDWTESEKAKLSQMGLFADTPKILHKVPYRFKYVIEDADGRERRLTIRDWELGMLFLKMRDLHGETKAIEKVKEKYFDQICGTGKDTRFFVGTMYPYNQWMVVGTFWPPHPRKPCQGDLFES